MSNLIKSGFVAFAQNDKLVINANENKIIKAIDADVEEKRVSEQTSVEEALAEALIHDAELDGVDFGDNDLLTVDTSNLTHLDITDEERQQKVDEILQAAQVDADAIVSKAHDEAEQLRAEAFDEAERIKSQAKEDGYQNGYSEAIEKASVEIAQKEADLEHRMQMVEQELQERKAILTKEMENQMIDLLCRLIPSITGVVIDGQKDVLLYMINNAMHDLDNSKNFIIKVSSDDYNELLERKEEIYGALNPAIDMEIFEDSKLEPMQCMIETDNGIVDVSLDVQLDNLITALRLMTKE